MIDLTISDEAAVLALVMFSVLGLAFVGGALWDGVVWLLTRKHRKKYRITTIFHCNSLDVKYDKPESSQ